MEIKTTKRHHFKPPRKIKIEKPDSTLWKGCRAKVTPILLIAMLIGTGNLENYFVLFTKTEQLTSYDPVILFLGEKHTCVHMCQGIEV